MTFATIKALQSGRYNEILDHFRTHSPKNNSDIVGLVGAYAFLGRIDEARELLRGRDKRLPTKDLIACRFFLGIALTRISRLKEGHRLFGDNLRLAKTQKVGRAYAAQGIGFYFYFIGKFALARKYARLALRFAIEEHSVFVHYLAQDLLGHTLVQLGRRPEGLRLMGEAKTLALKSGNVNFAAAFEAAALIYQSEAGWRPQTIVRELESAVRDLRASDSYTLNNLLLELARQLILRGRWRDARTLLDENAPQIYKFGNRRQEFVLQLRLGDLALYQGDFSSAAHFIQGAKRCLNRVADRNFEIRLLGLECKLARVQGREVPPEPVARLIELTAEFSTSINQQMLFRQGLHPDPAISETEDPLGALFRLNLRNPNEAQKRSLAIGYIGLWPTFKGLKPGTKSIVLLDDMRSLLLTAPDGTFLKTAAVTPRLISFLQNVAQGRGRKDQLIKTVWGYTYHPLRHDPLLYSAVAKLRKTLEPFGEWLVNTDNGWQLKPEILCDLKFDPKTVLPIEELPAEPERFTPRQHLAIKELRRRGVWTIKSYKEAYDVSTMTAFRDLRYLLKCGVLIRVGKGRSTRYGLSPETREAK